MRSHAIQRAGLLILIAFFAIYTTIEYLSTRNVLAQCVAITAVAQTSPKVDVPELKVVSDSASSEMNLENIVTWKDEEEEQHRAEEKVTQLAKSAAIGKVTMLYGPWAELEDNKAVLQTHKDHATLHNHSIHVLDRKIMHGMWSKLSYMLLLVLEELVKPEELRTKWLFWFDLDIIVMNRNIPLDIFLPPDEDFSHVHLLVTNDHNGLNTGSFFIRVNEWAVKYLVDIIALHSYRPDVKLKYSDQSAQEFTTLDKRYVDNTTYVPQRWFNAYRGPRNAREQLIRGEEVPPNTIKAGDLQLHFAGKKVKHLIPTYLAIAANNTLGWEMPLAETKLKKEIALFWKLEREKQGWNAPVTSKISKGKIASPAAPGQMALSDPKSTVKESAGSLDTVVVEAGEAQGAELGSELTASRIVGNSEPVQANTDGTEEVLESR